MAVDQTKYLSPNEVVAIKSADLTRRERLLVEVALGTGLRVSELARLTVQDFDLHRNVISVTRSKKRGKPNADKIPLSVAVRRVILTEISARSTISPEEPLFIGQRGRLTARGLQKLWQSACKKAGLRDSHIHQARHTLAVALLKTATNPSQSVRLVQKQLGHSKIETTASLYADVPWDDRQQSLDAACASMGVCCSMQP